MIHIFYRHTNVYNLGNYRPNWFSYRNCFINLLKSIKPHQNIVKLNVVFDGDITKSEIYNLDYNYETYIIQGGSDISSWKITNQIIKEQCDKNIIKSEDLIYFLENDYLHTQNWIEKLLEVFEKHSDKYVSLYDHKDKYFEYNRTSCEIFVTDTHHWRTTPSTCGSYIVRKDVFEEDFRDIEIINEMCYGIGTTPDHYKFSVLNLYKKRQVITPIPGLSTHCMIDLLSPTIDWKQISETSYIEKNEDWLNYLINIPSDINEHLKTLVEYADKCNHITEMGVRDGHSTVAFLSSKAKKVVSYDIQYPDFFGTPLKDLQKYAETNNINYVFLNEDVLKVEIEITDILFIDTWHSYKQLDRELKLHAKNVKKYIILHDTTSYAETDEDHYSHLGDEWQPEGIGLWKAIQEFLEREKNWILEKRYHNNNGLTILKKEYSNNFSVCLFDHHNYPIPTEGIGGVLGAFQTLYTELKKYNVDLKAIVNNSSTLESSIGFEVLKLPFYEIENIRFGRVPISKYFNGDIFYSNSSGRHVGFDFDGFDGKWVACCHGCEEFVGGADTQIFVSNNQMIQHFRDGYIDSLSKNYGVIHNSIDSNEYFWEEGNHNRIVWMGRIDGAKAERLYEIAQLVDEKILAAGWYSDEWTWLFEKIMSTGKVEWVGRIDGIENKRKFYSNAKMSIHCSSFEDPCPLTILEAQACGIPVITYANGSMNEICCIKDLICSNLDEFKEKIKLDYYNPNHENLQKFIKENFSSDSYGVKYYELFKNIANEK